MQSLEKIRAEIERVTAELAALETAPLPREEWRARLHTWIDAQSTEYARDIAFQIGWARDPRPAPLRVVKLPIQQGPSNLIAAAHTEGAGVLGWLLGDLLHERLDQLIDQAPDYEAGPPMAERPAQREKLEAELYRLEAREERAVRALEAPGRTERRRPEARPEFVLAWEDDLERLAA